MTKFILFWAKGKFFLHKAFYFLGGTKAIIELERNPPLINKPKSTMRREEKRRKFNEAVINTLYPPPSPPSPPVLSLSLSLTVSDL